MSRQEADWQYRLGQAIKGHRQERGLSQTALANLLGHGKRWLIQIEAGRADVRIGDLVRLAEALGVPASTLVKAAPFADVQPPAKDDVAILSRLCQTHQYEAVLRRTQDLLQSGSSQRTQLIAHHYHGRALVELMRFEEALPHLAKARELARSLKDVALEAESLNWEALARRRLHDPMDLDVAREALRLYRTLPPDERVPDTEAQMLEHLGSCLSAIGEYSQAAAYYEESLHLPGTIRDMRRIASTCQNLGICEFELGNPDRAIALTEQALAVLRTAYQLGPPEASYLAAVENNLAVAYMRYGNLTRAEELLSSALQHVGSVGDLRLRVNVLLSQAELQQRKGNLQEALLTLLRALEIATATQANRYLVLTYKQLGEVYAEQGDLDWAEQCFEHALRFADLAKAGGLRARTEVARREALQKARGEVHAELTSSG
jgi:tetratricopeptide (TPR) repeat protein